MNNFEKLRKEKGFSLRDIEDEIGVNKDTYHGYEKGTKKHYQSLKRIAEYYGVSIDALFDTQPVDSPALDKKKKETDNPRKDDAPMTLLGLNRMIEIYSRDYELKKYWILYG